MNAVLKDTDLILIVVLFLGSVVLGLAGLLRRPGTRRGPLDLLGRPRVQATLVLIAGPLLALVWACRSADLLSPLREVSPPHRPELRAAIGVQAVTDRGRPVPLQTPTEAVATGINRDSEAGLIERPNLHLRLLRTGPVDPVCNCHGWVFTDGRFWIDSEYVDAILADNGYRTVEQPRAGDLAVYRGPGGQILHTGLVRLVDASRVLLESKWGPFGRYLHDAVDHCYAGPCMFFRSDRFDGHRLRLEADASGNALSVAEAE